MKIVLSRYLQLLEVGAAVFAVICGMLVGSAPAFAQNLVLNPGFETGGPSLPFPPAAGVGWYQDPSSVGSVTISTTDPHTGTGSAKLSSLSLNAAALLDQNLIGLVDGQPATVSFWAATTANGFLQPALGGVGFSTAILPAEGYTFYTATVTPTSGNLLTFNWASYNGVSTTMYIDDVTVTQVPEPSTWSLLAFGISAVIGRRMVRRRKA